MKYTRKGLVCALGCLAGANANAIAPGNPYETIIAANVFHLVAARAIAPPTNEPPLPKIIPNGIITILGKRVLFKVQWPARPNEPAREQFYILAEGEQAGGIEVLEIDEKSATVKFNNNGTLMLLGLAKDGGKPSALPNVNIATSIQTPPPPQAPSEATRFSREQQIILMEIEREKSKSAIQQGALPPLPSTPLSPR